MKLDGFPFDLDVDPDAAYVIGTLTWQNILLTDERDDLRRQAALLRREVLVQRKKARMLRQKLRATDHPAEVQK